MAGEAARGRLGKLSGARRRQVQRAGEKIRAERRRRGVHLRAQGRLRRRREAGVEREAVLASGQYRRHPLAHHPSRLHHAQAIVRRAEGAGRRRTRRGAAVDRAGGCGRYHRRSRAGPEIGVTTKVILGTATPGGGFPLYGGAFAETINETDSALAVEPRNTKGSTENMPLLEAG